MITRVVAAIACLGIACDTAGVYDHNPFLSGNYIPAVVRPSVPVDAVKPAPINNQQGSPKLAQYCLGPRGQFQGEYCNRFVDCWEDRVVEFSCSDPLVFNPKGYCDYPINVDCGGKAVLVTSGSPASPANDGSYVPQPAAPVIQGPSLSPSGWPTDGSYRPPPVNGDGSYIPAQVSGDDGSWKPGHGGWDDGSYKPPSSTIEPPTLAPAISSTNAPVTYPSTSWVPTQASTTASPVPTEAPQLVSNQYCKQPRGQFPGSSCNKYVNCWDNIVVEQECPDGLNFNPYKGYCDHHWHYDCSQTLGGPSTAPPTQLPIWVPTHPPTWTPTPPSPTQSTLSPQLPVNTVCKNHRGQFAGSACNKYVNCWDGIVVEQECPEGFNFNADKGYCDYPWNYNCTQGSAGIPTTSAPATNNPTQATGTGVVAPAGGSHLLKFCLKPRGQFASTSCDKFVNCWDGYVVEQECPSGLSFSAEKGYCGYVIDKNCRKADTIAQVGSDSNSEECPVTQGTFRRKNDCVNYYTCIGNKIVAQYACPKGYLFNDVIGVCDIEHRVDCTKEPFIYYSSFRTINGNKPLLPAAVIDPSLPCKSGTIFRLNENCSHVAICRNGLTEIVQCPQGLKYDLTKDACLEPQLAKC